MSLVRRSCETRQHLSHDERVMEWGNAYCAIFQLGLVENGIGRWQFWWVFVPYRCAMREHEPGARNSEI